MKKYSFRNPITVIKKQITVILNKTDNEIFARDIAQNLESALEEFKGIYEDLEEK